MGHRIDSSGIHKSDIHIEVARDSPISSIDELQLFLGKATYYASFIPNLSARARALWDVLLKNPFQWSKEADAAYNDIKNALISP